MESRDATTDAVDSSDTITLDVKVGDDVECVLGQLKGVRGTLVASRSGGRVLVRLAKGMYLELPRFCVQRRPR
jgi:hypothetical protein